VKILYIILLLSLIDNGFVNGQNYWKKNKLRVPPPVCYASNKIEKSFIPPPAEFLLKSGEEKKSDIIVKYSLFPTEAKAAFEYAVNIWEHIIESEIPIYIEARWRTIYDEDGNTNTILGHAGPTEYYSDFEYAPRKNRFYPVCIVEKITKTEISGSSSPDISATFNKEFKWYFGTDGQTPDLMHDFVTVVLHEIGHGLGFAGFFFVSGNVGSYGNADAGDATSFDIMVVKDQNKLLTDTTIFKFPSSNLYNAFTSNQLYSSSPTATTNNFGQMPRLYAPSKWNEGSSINHLNDDTYPSKNENSLMTHAIGKGEAIHDPGPITKGIFADIGWKVMKLHLDKPKDIEEKKQIAFNLSIESDFVLDTNSVFIYFSTDSFKSDNNSMPLFYNAEQDNFSTILDPASDTGKIDYYVSASDKMNRTFSLPSEAPAETYSVTIGPDTIAPEINHVPIPYLVSNGESMLVSAKVDDNLGIDTVYVEFLINNVPQQSFGLTLDSANVYKGFFNIDANFLNDGDEVKYRIIATDSSVKRNKTSSPADDYYKFKAEKIFEPISYYFNDFNILNNDFVLSDFRIYLAKNFKDKSLHSPHPYPSTGDNNSNYSFTTVLKHPIILKQNGTMSFDEVVLVEPGEVLSKFGDENFWDYVIVEGSKDHGRTWLPLASGYDSGAYPLWKNSYNKEFDYNDLSLAVGTPDWFIKREINLLENGNFEANDTILVRFRLFSDPHANGWGWAIDNLRIQSPTSATSTILSPGNISVYPNPFNDIINVNLQVNKNIEELAVEIFNLYGQKISSVKNRNVFGEITIKTDLSNLSNGMYFVVVKENGKQVNSQKIIKN
jgi:hypothetical protein